MYIVKLLTEAEIEVSDACKWYEDRQDGLGRLFLNEVNYVLDLIAQAPLQYQIRFSGKYRFAVLKKFPYCIVFRIEDDEKLVYVISVFHSSRNPVNF